MGKRQRVSSCVQKTCDSTRANSQQLMSRRREQRVRMAASFGRAHKPHQARQFALQPITEYISPRRERAAIVVGSRTITRPSIETPCGVCACAEGVKTKYQQLIFQAEVTCVDVSESAQRAGYHGVYYLLLIFASVSAYLCCTNCLLTGIDRFPKNEWFVRMMVECRMRWWMVDSQKVS